MNKALIEELVVEWIKEAAQKIKESFQNELEIDQKSGRNDLVTNMDKETETFFVEKIKEHFPDHRVFGEEGIAEKLEDLAGVVWIIDPIDGTLNFVLQQRDFAISIAIYVDGVGELAYIYDVEREELYTGERGKGAYLNGKKIPPLDKNKTLDDLLLIINQSTLYHYPELRKAISRSRGLRLQGAATLEFMSVATGRAGAYVSRTLQPWDIAAGKIIAGEIGAIVTRMDGTEIDMLTGGTIVVASPKIHEELVQNYLS